VAISVRNVSKRFGDFVALDDVSVEVPSGSLTALLGPSGGGKSTLLRIIAGLETPDAGTVEIAGAAATHLPPQRRNVGFVFQHYAAFKHMSVARNVAFGLEIRKRPKAEVKERVDELLKLVHLEQFAHRLPSQLSGGQRQRMALARALAVEPEVLLLDEPFGALDALTRAHLQDSVMQIHEKLGNTVLMITHDVDEAVLLSDRVVMMTNGPAARIGEVLDVPLARPRRRLELVSDAAYLRCRSAVLTFLYERHRFVEAA
jgi:sulfate transport system ATP-binding protein